MEQSSILQQGYAEAGKFSPINAVFRELVSCVLKEDVLVLEGSADASDKLDIKGTMKYCGIEVGIESEDNPGYHQPKSVQEFSERGYVMIVCTCRTNGEIRNIIDAVSKQYNYHQFAILHFCLREQSKDLYSIINMEYADSVVRWIDWWIDNK